MKLWNWLANNSRILLKSLWWLATLAFTVYLSIIRFSQITSMTPIPFDIGLIGLVIVLILLPFVSEISAFGFTIKKQFEQVKQELKQDIKDETQSIRNEILAIGISNKLTSNLYIQNTQNPPSDNELSAIKEQISEVLKQFQKERGIQDLPRFDRNVSDNTIYSFTQRYLIEQEIKRIWGTRIVNGDFYRYPGFARMVDDLVRFDLITSNIGGMLREVFAVASSAIHGNEPSQEKIDFLKDVCPEILATLKTIK